MIRFSAFLVAVAVGLLVAGVVTSRLALVYGAIAVSGVALLALGIGVLIKRHELFGQPGSAQPELKLPEPGLAQPVPAVAYVAPAQPGQQAAVPVGSARPAVPAGPAPADVPGRPLAPPPPRPPSGMSMTGDASTAWTRREDAPATQPLPQVPRQAPAAQEPPAAKQPPAAQEPPAVQEPPESPEHSAPPTVAVAAAAAASPPPEAPPPEAAAPEARCARTRCARHPAAG